MRAACAQLCACASIDFRFLSLQDDLEAHAARWWCAEYLDTVRSDNNGRVLGYYWKPQCAWKLEGIQYIGCWQNLTLPQQYCITYTVVGNSKQVHFFRARLKWIACFGQSGRQGIVLCKQALTVYLSLNSIVERERKRERVRERRREISYEHPYIHTCTLPLFLSNTHEHNLHAFIHAHRTCYYMYNIRTCIYVDAYIYACTKKSKLM